MSDMDERTFRQTLREIAEAELPQIDSRREMILEKAGAMNKRVRFVLYLRGMAAVMMLLMVVSVVYQIAYPPLQPTFPEEDQLFTQLNLQKTIGDVTVTVHWVYFDVKTIRLRYSVTGRDEWLVRQVSRRQGSDLRDRLGNQFTSDSDVPYNLALSGTTSNAEKLSDGDFRVTVDESYNTPFFWKPGIDLSTQSRDYLAQYRVPPSEVELIFEVNRNGFAIPETMLPRPEATQEASPTRPARGSAVEDDVFRFEFSTPIYTPRVFEPDQTVVVGDVDVRLSRIELTPAVTSLFLCHDLPGFPGWVIHEAKLRLDGREGIWKTTTWRGECDRVDFEIFYDGDPTTLQFEWAFFQDGGDRGSPASLEEWEYIVPLLEEQGLKLEIEQREHGMSWDVRNLDGTKPEGRDWGRFYRNILYEAGLRDRIYGPWKYTVELGEADAD
jgi:hypothetical protein